MTTEMERVWTRMKETAKVLADHDETPSNAHAFAIVGQIIRQEHALSTPSEALDYLALELERMVGEYKNGVASLPKTPVE